MRVRARHSWDLSPDEAVRLQRELADEVVTEGDPGDVGKVGGVDVGVKGERARAAVVVLSFPELELLDWAVAEGKVDFPYIPGLLSFRECPIVLRAFEELSTEPEVVIVDGQGIAHPRRLGIASHLGLFIGVPTVGCAKSRLWGRHGEPGAEAGSYSYLYDRGEVIGAVVRTRDKVKPVYVSPGHLIGLGPAIRLILATCRGYRLPEPIRWAHRVAGGTNPEGREEI
ncbi:MAG: deoxyribonuclease V [Candidatus Latescibacterota bacterium]|nr:MAG: deoxyribonuclease V [Candidatus Latescibacterota bacterium]